MSSLVQIGPVVLVKEVSTFSDFLAIIFSCKEAWTFNWENGDFPHPRKLYDKCGWNKASGSGAEDLLIVDNAYTLFCNERTFIEQIWIPYTKVYFVQRFVETGPVVPERIFDHW